MIGFDASTGLRVSKAESLDVKSLRDDADGPQACFFVFDVLYLNGRVLTGRPFKERLQVRVERNDGTSEDGDCRS